MKPNNQITSKQEFFSLIEPILAPSELLMIEGAYIFAKFGHRYQKRKERDENGLKVRYFEHVRRTAVILIEELKVTDPNLIAAALLHDTIEDTKDVTAELIEYMFNAKVARIVRTLSNIPKQGYYNRLANSDKDVLIVKLCDRLDNMRTIDHAYIDESFRLRKAKETINKYIHLFNSKLLDSSNNMIKFGPTIDELNKLCINYISRVTDNLK